MNTHLLEDKKEVSVHDILVQSQYVIEPDFEEEIIPRKVIEKRQARLNTYYKNVFFVFFSLPYGN